MSYLGLDETRLLGVIDGLNRLFCVQLDVEDVAEEGALVAMALTGATGTSITVSSDVLRRVYAQGDISSIGSELTLNLEHEGRAVGVMTAVKRSEEGFGEPDVEALRLLATGLAGQIEHALAHELVTNESRVDPVTGLGNRLAFEERLGWELSRSSRYMEKLSLALVSIDDPAGLGARFGPEATDRIFGEVAEILSRGRSADSCFRLESGTFAIIMPNTSAEGAEIAAIRMAWEVALLQGGGAITASTGVAESDVPDARVLLSAAEASLRSVRA